MKPVNIGAYVFKTCENLIKSFNPVTHSIDTHCLEVLGDVNSPHSVSKPEDVLIQQIVYGWYKEKPILKCFIDDFYAERASRVLRSDITLYTIFAYIAIFRLEEMGFRKFKELVLSQEPSKVNTFITYLFDEETLWSTIRASWMKVRDLDFVENVMIKTAEKFIPDMGRLSLELEQNVVINAAAEAAKEEIKAKGEAGLTKKTKKSSTIPISPRLNKSKLPILPEPERISNEVVAKDVPGFINNTNLNQINTLRKEHYEKTKEETANQYPKNKIFKFNKTKGGTDMDKLKNELENSFESQLDFDKSFHKPPPDFKKKSMPVKNNISAILREDALYRKQQAKDAQILRNYEEELRDPTEYYLWQQDLKERDEVEKLKYVAMRREQAKQSSVEAKYAILKQKEDNLLVGSMLREQAGVIKQQKELENEISMLHNKVSKQQIKEVRDTKPIESKIKVLEERSENSKKLREELAEKRRKKELEDKEEEERKADKIRQLKALNSVHAPHVTVFDPTEVAGIGLLDEMSYMEMKVRKQQEKEKIEAAELRKREEIITLKTKKMTDLERRKESIMKAREVKASANKTLRMKEQEARRKEAEEKERARLRASKILEEELNAKREAAKAERDALKAEQEKTRRQQQYLGVARGQVEEMREKQINLAKDRQLRQMENEQKINEEKKLLAAKTDRLNTLKHKQRENMTKKEIEAIKEEEIKFEKKVAIEKLKTGVIDRKQKFQEGQKQHEITKNTLTEFNPYSMKISEESLTKARTNKKFENSLKSLSNKEKSLHFS